VGCDRLSPGTNTQQEPLKSETVPSCARTIVLFLLLTGGCAYFSIEKRDNLPENVIRHAGSKASGVYNSCVIKGRVPRIRGERHPVLVAAFHLPPLKNGRFPYLILQEAGPFMLYVPEGDYAVCAFTDRNEDGVFEQAELSHAYRQGQRICLHEGDVAGDVVVDPLGDHRERVVLPGDVRIADDSPARAYEGGNGQQVRIYDEKFSLENASVGLWAPSRFMQAFGANIYFLEPYDPHKIPVLFVHGAEGSPQAWAFFLMRLDRTRYQPWFFYYPSGMRLTLASEILYADLVELWESYRFPSLCITAHSMGGLVVRAMLTRHDSQPLDRLRILFVTLATPWSGFESADRSMKYSLKKLPVWFDMGSESPFIEKTLRANLPPNVRYYLLYGKEDLVCAERAMDERVYHGAEAKIGFPFDHGAILTEREVFRKYAEILRNEF
jgi:pimeloyl-ACP methyl ester carboxylesterase